MQYMTVSKKKKKKKKNQLIELACRYSAKNDTYGHI